MTALLDAVSYTHLDVYKRQGVGRALHRLADALVGVKLFTMTADNPRAGYVRRVYSSDEAAYPTPVSYTHLDVYKRQPASLP